MRASREQPASVLHLSSKSDSVKTSRNRLKPFRHWCFHLEKQMSNKSRGHLDEPLAAEAPTGCPERHIEYSFDQDLADDFSPPEPVRSKSVCNKLRWELQMTWPHSVSQKGTVAPPLSRAKGIRHFAQQTNSQKSKLAWSGETLDIETSQSENLYRDEL